MFLVDFSCHVIGDSGFACGIAYLSKICHFQWMLSGRFARNPRYSLTVRQLMLNCSQPVGDVIFLKVIFGDAMIPIWREMRKDLPTSAFAGWQKLEFVTF